jgi:forkhead box protein F
MFEDEGSLRRRPRGFRRKQLKSYGGGGAFYPTGSGYETSAIAVGDLPNCYTSQPYGSYEYNPAAVAAAVSNYPETWTYSTESLPQYQKIAHHSTIQSGTPPPTPSSHPSMEYGGYATYSPSPYASLDNGECEFSNFYRSIPINRGHKFDF